MSVASIQMLDCSCMRLAGSKLMQEVKEKCLAFNP